MVFVPPFAEEMNKCRPMMTRQARRLADQGFSSIVFDLYGTGDSQGEFGEATWNDWILNLLTIVRSNLIEIDRPLWLVSVRLGALLALDALKNSDVRVAGLVLWNPVLTGKTHINQFLRLRLASDIFAKDGQPDSVTDLRNTLAAGSSLEVAGYELSNRLVNPIDSLQLQDLVDPNVRTWLIESVEGDNRKSSIAARKMADRSAASGADITLMTVDGPPFWATQEIAVAPNLIEQTSDIIVGAA